MEQLPAPRPFTALACLLAALIALASAGRLLASPVRAAATAVTTSSTAGQQPSARARFDRALAAQQRGDLQRAAHEYRQLLRLRPDLLAAHANLGVVLVGLKCFDQAIAQYRAALALAPGNQALQLDLALAYYKKKDWTAAAAGLTPLHQLQPDAARISILLGDCRLQLGHPQQAIALLQPLTVYPGADPDLDWVLGQALIRTHHLNQGVQRVERVAAQRNSADAWALAARTRIDLEDFAGARRDLADARRLQPGLPGLALLDGMIRSYSGDDAGAKAAFEKAIQTDPQNFDAHLYLGMVLYTQGQWDAARSEFEWALRHRPASAMARYQLARVQAATGQLAAALTNLQQVEQRDPNWLKPHIELAALYFRMKRLKDGARERKIVDQLSAAQQQSQSGERTLSAPAP